MSELAGIMALLLFLAGGGAFYFCLGRAAWPRHERLPFPEFETSDLLATLRHGWRAAGDHSVLSSVISEMHRRRR